MVEVIHIGAPKVGQGSAVGGIGGAKGREDSSVDDSVRHGVEVVVQGLSYRQSAHRISFDLVSRVDALQPPETIIHMKGVSET
jgi:hypothetical protein